MSFSRFLYVLIFSSILLLRKEVRMGIRKRILCRTTIDSVKADFFSVVRMVSTETIL